MFMIPIPPTSSETAAMPASSIEKTCVVWPSVSRKSDWLRIWKSSGRSGRSLCSRRRIFWMSAIVSGIRSSLGASTEIERSRSWPITR
ncbi:hypothetical protein D3C83_42760 [compost metagenome]